MKPLPFDVPRAYHLAVEAFDDASLREGGFLEVNQASMAVEFVAREFPCVVTDRFKVWTPWWVQVFYDAEHLDDETIRCVTDVETRNLYLLQLLRDGTRKENAGGPDAAKARISLRAVPTDLQLIAKYLPDRLALALRDPEVRKEAGQLVSDATAAAINLERSA